MGHERFANQRREESSSTKQFGFIEVNCVEQARWHVHSACLACLSLLLEPCAAFWGLFQAGPQDLRCIGWGESAGSSHFQVCSRISAPSGGATTRAKSRASFSTKSLRWAEKLRCRTAPLLWSPSRLWLIPGTVFVCCHVFAKFVNLKCCNCSWWRLLSLYALTFLSLFFLTWVSLSVIGCCWKG